MRGYLVRVFLLTFCLLTVIACDKTSEQDLVIATIRNMEAAAESAEGAEFMAHVADDFAGNQGMDRRLLKSILLRQLNQYSKITAQLGPIRVTIHDGEPLRATAKFEALLLGGQGWLPEDGQLYEFTTGWRKKGSKWMLINTEWDEVVG